MLLQLPMLHKEWYIKSRNEMWFYQEIEGGSPGMTQYIIIYEDIKVVWQSLGRG